LYLTFSKYHYITGTRVFGMRAVDHDVSADTHLRVILALHERRADDNDAMNIQEHVSSSAIRAVDCVNPQVCNMHRLSCK
jgi:hypothetical protein